MSEHRRILVVDDEARMRRFVRMNLELEGFLVLEASDGLEAIRKTREEMPDLVLLDVEMPKLDGFETLREIRRTSPVPVIMLTVRSEEDDLIRGLDLGADDYVTKPFSARELVSRVNALLRRVELSSPGDHSGRIDIDDRLSVDFDRREVLVDGKPVKLRPTEYRLLHHMVQNQGITLSHEQLLSKVWGPEYVDDNQLLRVYIAYLRQNIEPDPSNPRYIFNERGYGYRFADV
ncbi:MAG: response regulator transcription factor [Caldilineae bacterium]|nr:response regulator transcription factor [Anaerolineae bacterium]MCB0198492.1 response regulator transcription factor [Anaerolineae bacterium]MCB0203240.1 response regulator transcription factor [Anaerolineae bacterium]MCB0253775.1 response regulator transcription factor [Anaerolineae bacterium]MCB9152962.1 response regulator transcription factor [Caldilineae bacterium]